jgi:hypothetical protein
VNAKLFALCANCVTFVRCDRLLGLNVMEDRFHEMTFVRHLTRGMPRTHGRKRVRNAGISKSNVEAYFWSLLCCWNIGALGKVTCRRLQKKWLYRHWRGSNVEH